MFFRYASLLFGKVTLLSHDCNHNTDRQILEKEIELDKGQVARIEMFIRLVAKRTIEIGEQITIAYTDCSMGVKERRADLKQLFYFDCLCKRCVSEDMANLNI